MTNPHLQAAEQVFAWPLEPQQRKHGPAGYVNYRSFKPWLRDEFTFRCVYCLTRERWVPNGHEEFSVEHVATRTATSDRSVEYDNLIYACCSCNRFRQNAELPFDPTIELLARHLQLTTDGTVKWLSEDGRLLLRICHLNRPLLVQFRRRLQALLAHLVSSSDVGVRQLFRELLGFPEDLPDLLSKRPPGGNSRTEGLSNSYFELHRRGELSDLY